MEEPCHTTHRRMMMRLRSFTEYLRYSVSGMLIPARANHAAESLKMALAGMLIFALMTGCSKVSDDWETYTVEAGEERCHAPSLQLGSNCLDFQLLTDESWVWTEPGEYHSHGGVAKVLRYSDHINHRQASNALGYKHEMGYGVLGHFVERNTGTYDWRAMDTILTPESTSYEVQRYVRLSREGDYYVCRIEDKESRIKAPKNRWWSSIHYPCMAGSFRVWHDWTVRIKIDK